MSGGSDLSCWDIMECTSEQVEQCYAAQSQGNCWEVMEALDSPCANVCEDCLVYILKQEPSKLSPLEIETILQQRGLKSSQSKQRCQLYHAHLPVLDAA